MRCSIQSFMELTRTEKKKKKKLSKSVKGGRGMGSPSLFDFTHSNIQCCNRAVPVFNNAWKIMVF